MEGKQEKPKKKKKVGKFACHPAVDCRIDRCRSHSFLSTFRDFEPTFSQYRFSAPEYFAVMAALPLVKGTEKNSLILEEVKKKDRVYLHFEAENPAQIAAETLEAYKQFSTPELQQAAAAVKNKIEKGE